MADSDRTNDLLMKIIFELEAINEYLQNERMNRVIVEALEENRQFQEDRDAAIKEIGRRSRRSFEELRRELRQTDKPKTIL